MIQPLFAAVAVVWWADMAVLSFLGPIGANPLGHLILYLIAFVCMVTMVSAFPNDIDTRFALRGIVALGISVRLLFITYPVGNDVYRYVWEGVIQLYGYNPYAVAPDSPVLRVLAQGDAAPVWPLINHPDLPAAYPPLTMLLFRCLAGIHPTPFFFKWVMMTFDIAVLLLLSLMIRRNGTPPRRLLFYAANPLVILYASGEGHLDVFQVLWLVLALYFFSQQKDGPGLFVLGLAVVSKYLALAALPFVLTARNVNKSWLALLPLLFYLPYWDAGSMLFFSLKRFSLDMHYNDSIYAILRGVAGDGAMGVNLLLLVLVFGWLFLFVHNRSFSVYLSIGCMLLFLPTLHPWYLIMVAPFMAFYPSAGWVYLQAAMAFTFPVIGAEYATGVFQELSWAKWFIYAPFFALLIWRRPFGARARPHRLNPAVNSVSVVVPTLNEGCRISKCLRSVMAQPALTDVVVVDGGSRDDTRLRAETMGATVLTSPKGRGIQIEAGVGRCRGDVIVVLHADSVLSAGTVAVILDQLNRHPFAVGGAVGMRFAKPGPVAGLVAFLNNLRTRLTGIAFGDQAQFFRSHALTAAGGFPRVMLMEDVELSLRLKKLGGMVFIQNGVTVSSRRWQGRNAFGKVWLVLNLFTRYLICRRLGVEDHLNAAYYRAYYGGDETK